ncbi:hypothetical protein [Paenibacillus sp. CCS19]|uniref:hypothetical protein n=1 Tax=Paenibacillus sp. CCS19 TaxID=3158387 RepID=UPI00295E29E4|nr:hypothetical protein [Paenibacillus cellulosilyticus]
MQTENEAMSINARHGSVLLGAYDDMGAQTVFDKADRTVQNALSAAKREKPALDMGWFANRAGG